MEKKLVAMNSTIKANNANTLIDKKKEDHFKKMEKLLVRNAENDTKIFSMNLMCTELIYRNNKKQSPFKARKAANCTG